MEMTTEKKIPPWSLDDLCRDAALNTGPTIKDREKLMETTRYQL